MIIFIRDYFNSEVKILLRNTGYAFIAIIILFIPGLIFILIGYFLKFKSDEVAREFRERTNFQL